MTKLAIYKYHSTDDADAAREHLRNLLGRFGNTGKKLSAEYELDTYMAWAEREGLIVADRRVRISYDLGSGVLLGGEVSRVDVDVIGGGYRAILLGAHGPDWGTELRTALLQRAVAQHFNRDEAEVAVGVQDLDGSGLETLRFTLEEIDVADMQARALATQLAAEWARQA
jgi:hypothetical protein